MPKTATINLLHTGPKVKEKNILCLVLRSGYSIMTTSGVDGSQLNLFLTISTLGG